MTKLVVLVYWNLQTNIKNSMRRAKKCLSPMPMGVKWCSNVPLGRCWRSNKLRKEDEDNFHYESDYKQGLFIRFWLERGKLNLQLPNQWHFLACSRMSALFFVQGTFAWSGGKWRWLGTGERCRNWRAIAIQVTWKKPWLQYTHWGSLTPWS